MAGTRFEPVVVRQWDVFARNWPASLSGLRLAHLSDLHFTRSTRATRHAQHLLKTLDYDFLMVTGDFGLFHRWWRHAVQMTREFFSPLVDRAPMYAVLGNHDDPQIAAAGNLPLTFLRDESVEVPWNGTALTLAGIEQTLPRGGNLEMALAGARANRPTILLAHYPSTAYSLNDRKVQLVLSGHTHGGQIRLPWLGCIWPNDRIPRKMSSGLHLVNDIHVHVSAGIGVSLPLRMRINCPPEIAILTMRSTS